MGRSVIVIGGGIAGLTVSFELAERAERLDQPLDLLCLEASDRPGGNIRSDREGKFLCEWAANGFLDNAPDTVTLVRRLGLEDRVLKAREAAERRFIFRSGKLRRVPTTPGAFLRSDILSLGGKLRLLMEPVIRPRRDPSDETVFDFAARRIGRQAAAVLVDAMVSGIYAGDVRRLSLSATFPRMRQMEDDHGTLFRAMLARRRQARNDGGAVGGPAGPGGCLTSFRDGMQELPAALADRLGSRLRLSCPVTRLSSMGNRGIRVHPREGAPIDADAVILACPAWSAATIVEPMDAAISEALAAIPSAALAVVHLGYRRDAIAGPPEGFGFLVPRGQGPRILGCLWSSRIFDERAPDGSALLTVMIGGAHDPDAVEMNDNRLHEAVRRDLLTTMNIRADPYFVRTIRHPRGIPQYELGHPGRLRTIDERRAANPGLWLTGNSLRGIAINACVEEAPGVAESVLEFLARKD